MSLNQSMLGVVWSKNVWSTANPSRATRVPGRSARSSDQVPSAVHEVLRAATGLLHQLANAFPEAAVVRTSCRQRNAHAHIPATSAVASTSSLRTTSSTRRHMRGSRSPLPGPGTAPSFRKRTVSHAEYLPSMSISACHDRRSRTPRHTPLPSKHSFPPHHHAPTRAPHRPIPARCAHRPPPTPGSHSRTLTSPCRFERKCSPARKRPQTTGSQAATN